MILSGCYTQWDNDGSVAQPCLNVKLKWKVCRTGHTSVLRVTNVVPVQCAPVREEASPHLGTARDRRLTMTTDHKAGTTRDHKVGTNGDPKAGTARGSTGSTAGKIVAFAAGAAVGAAAALLLAPKSGEELRGDISDAVNDGAKQVRSAGRNLKRRAQEIVELATDTVQDALDAGDVAYTKAKKS